MRATILLATLLAIAALANGQCTFTSVDSWESDFDLTPLQIPTVVLRTQIRFTASGFESLSSYRDQCFVASNGTYDFSDPYLTFNVVGVTDPQPNPTSVTCQILGVSALAIGSDAFLPPSNVTFSSDCKSFNMTFTDSAGLLQSRQFVPGSALAIIPSVLLILLAAVAHFF